jgi:PEP-CTERM motif
MFNRFALSIAALALCAAPVLANGAHVEKGASGNGLSTDAFFGTTSTGSNGVAETPYTNTNDSVDTVIDVFQIPSNFTAGTGTPYTMTFASVLPNADGALYGEFFCNNGSSGTAISVPQGATNTPVALGSTCTAGSLDSSGTSPFLSFNQVGNSVTVTFLGGSNAPTNWYFWTTDGNLLSLKAASGSTGVPEPGTFALLAAGLIGLGLIRRRAEQA